MCVDQCLSKKCYKINQIINSAKGPVIMGEKKSFFSIDLFLLLLLCCFKKTTKDEQCKSDPPYPQLSENV